jgi:large subunit GTPase 1
VGYPNVGKSSTINALFGAKKTAVAPTPGKTKHFQTLIVSPTLCLCDCPGKRHSVTCDCAHHIG